MTSCQRCPNFISTPPPLILIILPVELPPVCSVKLSRVRSLAILTFNTQLTVMLYLPVGEIPSYKLIETEKRRVGWSPVTSRLFGSVGALTFHTSFSFLDIGPLARGHSLVIPKCALGFPIDCLVTRLIKLTFRWR